MLILIYKLMTDFSSRTFCPGYRLLKGSSRGDTPEANPPQLESLQTQTGSFMASGTEHDMAYAGYLT